MKYLLVMIVLHLGACAYKCKKECCPKPGHGPCPICHYLND